MANAEGGSVPSGMGFGERCPLPSWLEGLGERREFPQSGAGQRSPGRKRILAYFEGHRTLLFVSIWQNLGWQFALASSVIYAHASRNPRPGTSRVIGEELTHWRKLRDEDGLIWDGNVRNATMAGGHYETVAQDNEGTYLVSWFVTCIRLMKLIPHVRVCDRWQRCPVPRRLISTNLSLLVLLVSLLLKCKLGQSILLNFWFWSV